MRAKFVFSEVLQGLRRNITMTVAMIITTAISIGLLGSGLLVVQMSHATEQIYLDRVEVELFLTDDISTNDPDCTQATCAQLRQDLAEAAGQSSVTFVSRDEAYKIYQQQFASDPEMLSLVRPEALPASFKVKVDDQKLFGELDREFSERTGVQRVRTQADLVDRLFSVLDGIRNAAFAVALVQGVGAVLLIANMIQIAAFSRRTEVGIMRLVGASRWYTQLPFLLEVVVAAVVGSVLAVAGLFAANNLFIKDVLSDLYSSNIIARITDADIGLVAPILIGVSAVLAAVTGWITLRLYVRE
ncbi:permease-like cell division protein FtsX [Tomitella gaofuii]|uniref:permease-like cell division protein FtsX n=1 Tax=Tomitella gaofuii TaxID=2760083 RepID=UPI0015F8BE91|nr:permease-like cell division protein FtsX [Tomitella gaofuii]